MSEIRVNNVIADNGLDAVNFSKGINVSSGIITATSFSGSGANLTTLPAANLTGTLPAISGANLTGLSSGLSMADQWRITSGGTMTSDGITDFTSNWERGDTNSHGQIGSGMTQSSGIFTFPSTGIYQIMACMPFKRNSGDNRFAELQIQVTTNNSSYALAADGFATFSADYNINNAVANLLFDVTSTSTHKVKFRAYTNRSSVLFLGNTGYNENSFTFIKLGDT